MGMWCKVDIVVKANTVEIANAVKEISLTDYGMTNWITGDDETELVSECANGSCKLGIDWEDLLKTIKEVLKKQGTAKITEYCEEDIPFTTTYTLCRNGSIRQKTVYHDDDEE